jgi:hypothetical protein
MAAPGSIFISYRHDAPWTGLATRLDLKLRASAGPQTEVFFDARIPPGANWKQKVDEALERCTHFVALICDEYWVLSTECRRELERAVQRRQAGGVPHLLFVKAAEIRPELMRLEDGLEHLGQINFLGPFDAHAKLVTLARGGAKLDAQLGQLRDRLLSA